MDGSTAGCTPLCLNPTERAIPDQIDNTRTESQMVKCFSGLFATP